MAYNNARGIIAGTVIMQLLTTSSIILRFYYRFWKKASILITDWLILAAFVCGTGLTVLQIYGVAIKALAYPLNGTIEDSRAVTGRLNKAKHIELSYLLLGILALGFIKLSVCCLYWQIFAKVKFRGFLIVWIVVLVAWTLAFILAGLLECGSHLKALFGTPQEYLDHCGSAIPMGWSMVGSDVATDLITLIIPLPVIMSLRLSTTRKVLVLATFMIGAMSVAASAVKAYIYIAATLGRYTKDAIIILTELSIWNLAEVQIGIIAACGPTLRPILSQILPTESIKSILSSFRAQRSTRRSRDDATLPTFVRTHTTAVGSQRADSIGKGSETESSEQEI